MRARIVILSALLVLPQSLWADAQTDCERLVAELQRTGKLQLEPLQTPTTFCHLQASALDPRIAALEARVDELERRIDERWEKIVWPILKYVGPAIIAAITTKMATDGNSNQGATGK